MSTECSFLDPEGNVVTDKVTKVAMVTVDGYVSLSCYNDVTSKLEEAIRNGPGKIRVLEYIKSFCGLDPFAIVPNSLFNLRNHSAFERLALVTNSRALASTGLALAPVVEGEIRSYSDSDDQFTKAINWIIEGLGGSSAPLSREDAAKILGGGRVRGK